MGPNTEISNLCISFGISKEWDQTLRYKNDAPVVEFQNTWDQTPSYKIVGFKIYGTKHRDIKFMY